MYILLFLIVIEEQPYKTNPVSIVLDTGLKLYQTLISPAQGDVCNFTPSCSHFAKGSITRYGPFWGGLMAADRLMRCHPWSYRYFDSYYEGIKDFKIYDPIENNYIFGERRQHHQESRRPERRK